MFLGVVALVIVVAAGISKLFSEAKDAGVFQKQSFGLTRQDMTEILVKRDRHEPMLKWLDDPENYKEIERHVSNVLSQIWKRDVHYIPKHWASNDIRKVIYFVENGFLPGPFENDIYRVMWTNADNEPFGLTRMEPDEKMKLKVWVIDTMEKNGYNITTLLPTGGLWTFAKD